MKQSWPETVKHLHLSVDKEYAERLRSTLLDHTPHMTHQIWISDDQTKEVFWDGTREHALFVLDLPVNEPLENVFDIINCVTEEHSLHAT